MHFVSVSYRLIVTEMYHFGDRQFTETKQYYDSDANVCFILFQNVSEVAFFTLQR